MAKPEIWNPEQPDGWAFKPSGDGKTSLDANPGPPNPYFDMATQRITGYLFRMGHLYGYMDGVYFRKAVPSLAVIQEIAVLAKAMYKNTQYTCMNQSQGASAAHRLIFDLYRATETFPHPKNYACISPAHVNEVRTKLKRMKHVPEGLLADLARLEVLHGQIEFPSSFVENK